MLQIDIVVDGLYDTKLRV